MDGNTVTDFVHPPCVLRTRPLRFANAWEDTPPTTNLRQTPFNSPLHIKGEAENLPFAERRGRVQAKRRTQGMHETSPPSKPPLIPPWASRGRKGHCSPLHIKAEGGCGRERRDRFRASPACFARVPFASRRGGCPHPSTARCRLRRRPRFRPRFAWCRLGGGCRSG